MHLICDACKNFRIILKKPSKKDYAKFIFKSDLSSLKHGVSLFDGTFQECLSVCMLKRNQVKRLMITSDTYGQKKRTKYEVGLSFCAKEGIVIKPAALKKAVLTDFKEIEERISRDVSKIEALLLSMKNANNLFDYQMVADEDGLFIRVLVVLPYSRLLECPKRLVALDSAHLKDTMLTATNAEERRRLQKLKFAALTTRTSNNTNLLLAFSISLHETEEEYSELLRFCIQNKMDLNSPNQTIVSDRASAIANAISAQMPSAYHIPCAVHLERNLLAKFTKDDVEKYYWAAQKTCNVNEYNRIMIQMSKECPAMHKYLSEIRDWQRHKWYQRYLATNNLIPYVFSNNNVEQFFGAIREIRYSDPFNFLKQLFDYVAITNNKKAKELKMHNEELTKYAKTKLAEEKLKRMGNAYTLEEEDSDDRIALVIRNQFRYQVNLGNRTCSCFVWQQTGVPCAHACFYIEQITPTDVVCQYNPYMYEFCFTKYCLDEFKVITEFNLVSDFEIEMQHQELLENGEGQIRILTEVIPNKEGVSHRRIKSAGEGGKRNPTHCSACGLSLVGGRRHLKHSQYCRNHALKTKFSSTEAQTTGDGNSDEDTYCEKGINEDCDDDEGYNTDRQDPEGDAEGGPRCS